MVYVVLKKMGKNVYAYLYRCVREKGIPKQKYISYLGKIKGISKKKLKNIKSKSEFTKIREKIDNRKRK